MKPILILLIASIVGIHTSFGQTRNVDIITDSIASKLTYLKPDVEIKESKDMKMKDYPQLRLAVSGGFSNHTHEIFDKVSGDSREYFNQLRSGTNLGLDLHYYYFKPIGLGVQYVNFNSSSRIKNWSTSADENKNYELSIKFIGPSLSARLLHSTNKNALVFNMAYGYVDYKLIGLMGLENSIKGNSWAFRYNLSYDLGITSRFAFGLQVAYLNGYLDELRLVSGGSKENVKLEKDAYESLKRLDFSLGLRFNL